MLRFGAASGARQKKRRCAQIRATRQLTRQHRSHVAPSRSEAQGRRACDWQLVSATFGPPKFGHREKRLCSTETVTHRQRVRGRDSLRGAARCSWGEPPWSPFRWRHFKLAGWLWLVCIVFAVGRRAGPFASDQKNENRNQNGN